MEWLILYIGAIVYVWFKVDKFADSVNPYNFNKRK